MSVKITQNRSFHSLNTFRKTPVATGVSMFLAALVSVPSYAADDNPDADKKAAQVEVIDVRGIRGSLIRSMDVKRGKDGVVDGISAEDIGKFPDTNLAESLQRITGVSIDRQNGEGSRITVRGFGPDFNLVTLNGRQMPGASIQATSAAASRSFDFANLASEGISGVEVYKTGVATLPTGGIGSTVNILTARPLNNPGLQASVGVKGVHDLSTETGSSLTPELSAIYSNTFDDDKFGIAITGSFQERDSGFNSAETSSGWYTIKGYDADWGSLPTDGSFTNRPQENDVYSVPRNLVYTFNELQRTRTNGQVVLQYRPVSEVTMTLEYIYSDLKISQQKQELSTWFNGVPTSGEFTPGTNSDGSVVAPVIYTDATCCDVALGTGDWATKNENHSIAFNLQWAINDNLSFDFDYHDSSAEAGPGSKWGSNNIVSAVQFDRVSTTVDYSHDFPVMTIGYADGVSGLDPSRMMTSGSSFRNSIMRTDIEQMQAKGRYIFDDGIVSKIDFGLANTEVNNRSAFSNAQRDTWGGYGTPEDYDDSIFIQQGVASRFDNFSASGNGALEPYYYASSMQDLLDAISGIATANGETISPCGTELCPDPTFNTDRRAIEEQFSAFVQANLELDWNDMPIKVVVGLRYEDTDVRSEALVPRYSHIVWAGANEFVAQIDGQDFTELSGNYDHWLPNVDFSIEVIEDVVLRASYSKTITRPNYSDIQGGRTIDQIVRLNGGKGNSGNPNLKPFESTNVDFSAEWYYDEGSYFAIGYYDKQVENFIGQSTVQDTAFNLAHPGMGPRYEEAVAAVGSDSAAVRQYFFDQGWVNADGDIVGIDGEDPAAVFTFITPVNEKEASIDGFEIAWQHLFAETGFGVILNYTTVNGDIAYDNYNTNKGEGATNQFALLGLSDTANAVLFYDKDGFQARIAYNWRDQFLTDTIDGNGERNPVYTEAYGQFDANMSYDYSPNLTFFVEGINITDENRRLHGRHVNMVVAAIQSGARYNVGLRYKF